MRCHVEHSEDADLNPSSSRHHRRAKEKKNSIKCRARLGLVYLFRSFVPYLYIQFWLCFKTNLDTGLEHKTSHAQHL